MHSYGLFKLSWVIFWSIIAFPFALSLICLAFIAGGKSEAKRMIHNFF